MTVPPSDPLQTGSTGVQLDALSKHASPSASHVPVQQKVSPSQSSTGSSRSPAVDRHVPRVSRSNVSSTFSQQTPTPSHSLRSRGVAPCVSTHVRWSTTSREPSEYSQQSSQDERAASLA